MPSNLKVIELSYGMKDFHYGLDGVTASRQFLYAIPTIDDPTPMALLGTQISLPSIGDPYEYSITGDIDYVFPYSNLPFAKLYCRKIIMNTYGGSPYRYIYTCQYTNEPVDSSQFKDPPTDPDIFELPISIDSGGEFTLVTGSETSTTPWKWVSYGPDNTVAQGIAKTVVTTNFRVTRTVVDAEFLPLMNLIFEQLGTLNSKVFETPAGTFDSGIVLLTGVNVSQCLDWNGKDKYRFEFLFSARNANGVLTGGEASMDGNGPPLNGWCYIINIKSGKWDIAENADDFYMYDFNDFNLLFKNDVIAP